MFQEVLPKNPLFFTTEEEMNNYAKQQKSINKPEPEKKEPTYLQKCWHEHRIREEYLEYKRGVSPVLNGMQIIQKPKFVGKVWKKNKDCLHNYCVGKNTREEREILGSEHGTSSSRCKDCYRWYQEEPEFKKQVGEIRFAFHLFHNNSYKLPKGWEVSVPDNDHYKNTVEPKYYHWLYVDRDLKNFETFLSEHPMET